MYLNVLSSDAAKAHDQDLLAGAEQDRRLSIARRPQANIVGFARRVLHLRSVAG